MGSKSSKKESPPEIVHKFEEVYTLTQKIYSELPKSISSDIQKPTERTLYAIHSERDVDRVRKFELLLSSAMTGRDPTFISKWNPKIIDIKDAYPSFKGDGAIVVVVVCVPGDDSYSMMENVKHLDFSCPVFQFQLDHSDPEIDSIVNFAEKCLGIGGN